MYIDGSSYVWLTSACTRGNNNPNYVAVTSVQTAEGVPIIFCKWIYLLNDF